MVGCWQKDADCIFIFVSPCVRIHVALCINWNIMGQFNKLYFVAVAALFAVTLWPFWTCGQAVWIPLHTILGRFSPPRYAVWRIHSGFWAGYEP
jgi:hypothetical protein